MRRKILIATVMAVIALSLGACHVHTARHAHHKHHNHHHKGVVTKKVIHY